MSFLQRAVRAILLIIVIGAVLWLLWWLVGYLGLPAPFSKVANGILAVCGVFALIGVIMELAGFPIIKLPPQQ